METNRENTNQRFENALKKCMLKKFGQRISATRFADEYNLRAYGTTTISRETARKWMTGCAVPQYGRLAVLVKWLDLNPMEFFGTDKAALAALANSTQSESDVKNSQRLTSLMSIVQNLDEKSAEVVLLTAWALSTAMKTVNREGN